jgi:hypothetical protein
MYIYHTLVKVRLIFGETVRTTIFSVALRRFVREKNWSWRFDLNFLFLFVQAKRKEKDRISSRDHQYSSL